MTYSFLASVALNLLIFGLLVLVTVRENRPLPPTIVASAPPPRNEPPVEAPTMTRPVVAPPAGAMTTKVVTPVLAAAPSAFNMAVPDIPFADDGLIGLAGMGSGFGAGFADSGPGDGAEGGSMKVGKISVKSKRLGVVLDVSGSMEEHLREVRRQIRAAFGNAETVDVSGCRLDWKPPREQAVERPRLQNKAESVIEAMEMLIVAGKVDAIYWFSDLQDGETESGLARLRDLLQLEKGRGRAVRLYIRTLERQPSLDLTRIVKASGGAIQAGNEGVEEE